MNTQLFVLAHKQCDPLFNYSDMHNFIHTGAIFGNETSYSYRDDSGDNISNKNQIYSEMTGEYWVWKNYAPVDIIGFEHYRRHFPLSKDEIENLLSANYDIIVHSAIKTRIPIEMHYQICHSEFDIDLIKQIIADLYPDYTPSYNACIANNDIIIPCNMFITYWDTYDKMMKFIFDILFEFEKRINAQTIDDWMMHVKSYSKHTQPSYHLINGSTWQQYQLRICAFLAERLMTLWIYHNIPGDRIMPIDIDEIATAAPQN